MNLSASKIPLNSDFKNDNKLNFLNKENNSGAKLNVFPPKIHRNASYSSNLNLLPNLQTSSSLSFNQHHSSSSLSSNKLTTPNKFLNTRNFSKNKEPHLYGSTNISNSSFTLSGSNNNIQNSHSIYSNSNSNINNFSMSYLPIQSHNSKNLKSSSIQKDNNTSYDNQQYRFSTYTDTLESPNLYSAQNLSSQFYLTHPSLYTSNSNTSGILGEIRSSHSYGLKQQSSYIDIQKKIKELQSKVKHNQQKLKSYHEEVQLLKNQFSSTSRISLADNIDSNKNIPSLPTKQTLPLSKNQPQQQKDKQNINKNNSQPLLPEGNNSSQQLQKKTSKQIQSIKKQLKKILSNQQTIKADMKMFQLSIKQVLTGYKDYISRSAEQLSKKQQKNKKKIIDKINEELQKKVKDIFQKTLNEKKIIQNLKDIEKDLKQMNINGMKTKIQKSKEKFLKDPILIKIKQEVYGQINKVTLSNKNPQQSYEQMIKRNIYSAIGKPQTQLTPSTSPFTTKNAYMPFKSTMNSSFPSNDVHKQLQREDSVVLQSSQTTYYIDQQGYLLDSQGYYLLLTNSDNNNQQKIKLNSEQMNHLRQQGLLNG